MTFSLDSRLEADTLLVGDLALSRVLLMREARLDWLILVPRHEGLIEIIDLEPADQARLFSEITDVSRVMKTLNSSGKLNIGALGNVVSQLHIHVLNRQPGDHAWPGPIWGAERQLPDEKVMRQRAQLYARALSL